MSPPRGASGMLLTRLLGGVEATVIDRVEYLLVNGLAQGQSAAAAFHAAEAHPEANIGAAFKRLLDSGTIQYFEKWELN